MTKSLVRGNYAPSSSEDIKILNEEEFKNELKNKLISVAYNLEIYNNTEMMKSMVEALEILSTLSMISKISNDNLFKLADDIRKEQGTYLDRKYIEIKEIK